MEATNIFDKFYLFVIKNYRKYCTNSSFRHYKKLLKLHNIPLKKLTSEQKREVDKIWKGCGSYDYKTHRLVYSVSGKFDPRVMSEKLFRTTIEMQLNHQTFKNSWSDKSYFSWLWGKDLFPTNVVANVNGTFYDVNYNVVSEQQALELISKYDKLIIKPSIETGFGKNVALMDNCSDSDGVKAMFKKYGANFVVQEVLKQHEMLSSFNASSVNVIRFISLFIDGEVRPVMCALRCGAEGSISDNNITKDGMGMFVIGLDENGRLRNEAYHSCGKKITVCPNGVEFAGRELPGYHKMIEIIKECHSKMAHFGFVGWDFAIDENGEPRIMEYNIKGPGVLYYQYANGPLLGEYTEMIAERFKNK